MDENQNSITLEMLSPAQREIAGLIGLENYLRLSQYIDGDTLYIPKFDGLADDSERLQRDEEIVSKFDGYNFKALAKEYSLTTRSLYNIIPRSIRIAKRCAPMNGQVSMEEWAQRIEA